MDIEIKTSAGNYLLADVKFFYSSFRIVPVVVPDCSIGATIGVTIGDSGTNNEFIGDIIADMRRFL